MSKNGQTVLEYSAQAASHIINGEANMTIGDKSFTVTSLINAVEVPYCEVNDISFADHTVKVKTDNGDFTFTRMGEWGERFFDCLCDTYNKAVLRRYYSGLSPRHQTDSTQVLIHGNQN